MDLEFDLYCEEFWVGGKHDYIHIERDKTVLKRPRQCLHVNFHAIQLQAGLFPAI